MNSIENENNLVAKADQSFHRLMDYLIRNDFKGHEYDDLLASPFVNALTFNSLWLKIIAVQISKRFFLNLRPLLGVPKLHSTKAFGFIIKGILYHHLATGEKKYLAHAQRALSWLLENISKGYPGLSWGNDFDFASRAGFYKKGLPTIVWSSHIQEAFDLAWKVFKDETFKDAVIRIAEFTHQGLEFVKDSGGSYIAYSPGITIPIHNSNLLGVVALLRGWKYSGNKEHFIKAKEALNWSISKQNKDGSWYYGPIPMLHWIDNYHTGYNLDCLMKVREITGDELINEQVTQSTYSFWKNNLFTGKGQPKFYHNGLYPADIQACAQAIESFSKYLFHDDDAYLPMVRTTQWTLNNMQKPNGSFRYRIYKFRTYQLEAIHWGQATMLSALGHFIFCLKNRKNLNDAVINQTTPQDVP